jgi:DNA-binding transcriptional LysR family regulator
MRDQFDTLSWDDLRIIRAVGKRGTLALAAEMLGANTSTIARRLARVEEILGVSLFDRRRTGYVATQEGEELISLAERVELDVVGVTRRVSGFAQGHAGNLRITTSDSLLLHFFTPIIADFVANNPAIRLEVIVGNSALNLARGESDIAIRATNAPPENLFGRKVATIAWAPYACLSDSVSTETLFTRQWVSFAGKLSGLKACDFLQRQIHHCNIAYRTDSVAGAAAAIAAGLGVGYLPCMLGDLSRDLARVGDIEPELDDELWLLTHPDIRKSGRVYAFMTHCIDAIGKHRGLIEGLESRSDTPAGMPRCI